MKKLFINEINSVTGGQLRANYQEIKKDYQSRQFTKKLTTIVVGTSIILAVANFALMTPSFIKRYSELKQRHQPITIKSVIFDTIDKNLGKL
jgi:hypothetical protein